MELFRASHQWATRPDDQRFPDLESMYQACLLYAQQAREAPLPWSDIRVTSEGEDLVVELGPDRGDQTPRAKFSHWAFTNMCSKVQAPADYLRSLPAELAARNISTSLARVVPRGAHEAKALLHANGNGALLLRCLTSLMYTRIWNWEICERLRELPRGWRVPPARPSHEGAAGARPATPEDILEGASFGLSINVGDLIAPAGLYASDADMFAFFVNQENRINDGTEEGLSRGFFVENSEAGKMSFRLTTFLYRHVCGNHIVWGAQDVNDVRIRHVGLADVKAWEELHTMLDSYANATAGPTEALILLARRFIIGETKKETTVQVYKHLSTTVPLGMLEKAWDLASQNESDGDPSSAWGLAQGMTRLSQSVPFADRRVALDRGAGRILSMVNQ